MRRIGLAAAALVVASLPFTTRAFAASLGPVDGAAQSADVLPQVPNVPTVYGWDNFNRTMTLNNSVTPSGKVWRSQIGTWVANGTTGKTTTTSPLANIVMDAPTTEVSTVVTITPQGGNPRPGVTINDDGRNALIVQYSQLAAGTISLITYTNASRSPSAPPAASGRRTRPSSCA